MYCIKEIRTKATQYNHQASQRSCFSVWSEDAAKPLAIYKGVRFRQGEQFKQLHGQYIFHNLHLHRPSGKEVLHNRTEHYTTNSSITT